MTIILSQIMKSKQNHMVFPRYFQVGVLYRHPRNSTKSYAVQFGIGHGQ